MELENSSTITANSLDSQGNFLVTVLLDDTNFLIWKRAMRIALKSRGKIQFIEGRSKPPAEDSTDFWLWEKTDNMIFSWILSSISKELIPSFIHSNTAKELWENIEERYGISNGPLIYQVQCEINSLTQGNQSLRKHFGKMKMLWDEFDCHTAEMNIQELKDLYRLMEFLNSLHEGYDHIKQQILLMEPKPKVNKVYSMLLGVESSMNSRNLVPGNIEDTSAMLVKGTNHGGKESWKQKQTIDKSKLFCEYCKKKGHLKGSCFEIVGYPEWYKELQKNRSFDKKSGSSKYPHDNRTLAASVTEVVQKEIARLFNTQSTSQPMSDPISAHCSWDTAGNSLVFCSNIELSGYSRPLWILDTGASSHMCNDIRILQDSSINSLNRQVSLPDGTTRLISCVGKATLSNILELRDVLFIPSFKHNLLSVSKLTQHNNIHIVFYASHCILQDRKTQEILAIGKIHQGLYIIEEGSFKNIKQKRITDSGQSAQSVRQYYSETHNEANEVQNVCSKSLHLRWHQRLGHPSEFVFKHLNIPGVMNNDHSTFICDVCHESKQTRNSFLHRLEKVADPFHLIHIDIWGPYHEVSVSGAMYFLTLVDDSTRCTWTYMMQNKGQVVGVLLRFLRMVQTQYNAKVKIIRTDNGMEFLSKACQNVIIEFGIVHQRTCIYTPQQNGVVERKHRHLLQVARALILQASLPKKFWSEAILLATYIINRTPTSVLNWRTPYQLLYGKLPSYEDIKVFGSLCFATKTRPHRDKFDARTHKCIFLGFPMGQKGYKLYDLQLQSILISRDVQFHEHIFPFQGHNHIPDSSICQPRCVYPAETSSSSTNHITNLEAPDVLSGTPNQMSFEGTPVLPATQDANIDNENVTCPEVSSQLPLSLMDQPRKSSRTSAKPKWLNDYIVNYTSMPTYCPSIEHSCFLSKLLSHKEPSSYAAAKEIPEWVKAMEDELHALEKNQTWELTTLPSGKKAIGCKWVFKLKLKPDGSIDRFKARLVAKGYNQVAGLDYSDCFAPVAKVVTVRILFALAASYGWELHQLDINNAFLHGSLDEDVYMVPPDGYTKARTGEVCFLKKSLYGLKQASRQWNQELTNKLCQIGFVQSPHDHCLFIQQTSQIFLILLVYVDDILLTGSSESSIASVKAFLHQTFTIKDLGRAKYFLGIEVARSSSGIYLHQHKYVQDIIMDLGLTQAKSNPTPFPSGLKLDLNSGSPLAQPDRYRRLVGRLLYLSFTRPDITYAVQQLSQFVQHPHQQHWEAAVYLVRYLRGSSTHGLFYSSSSSLSVQAYCDADWASCSDSRRSLTGYCIFLGSSPISWKTKKRTTVSRSSAEAEYRSLASTVAEIKWVTYLLREFCIPPSGPIPLWCDSRAALHIIANPVFHERTKHLDIDCHFVRDEYKAGLIEPRYVCSSSQIADLFTKPLPAASFLALTSKLSMVSLPCPT